jgi:D-ribose pyranose/furanose isomerase RbsD
MVEKERVVQDFVKHALKAALKCTELEICTPALPLPQTVTEIDMETSQTVRNINNWHLIGI